MNSKHRVRLGGLDVSSIDPFDHDPEYIYGEVFEDQVYAHPRFTFAEPPVVVDVGANIGLFALWAAQFYRPRRILAYEASPTTFECLAENLAEHIDPAVSRAEIFNLAVSRETERVLKLHQAPYGSGLSTLLTGTTLSWIEELRATGELHEHSVQTTTLSREIALRGLERIDLLKIDVEGHFMEVLEGIEPADHDRIRHIAFEAEYAERLGHTADSLCGLLRERGYEAEAREAAQLMVYGWRS